MNSPIPRNRKCPVCKKMFTNNGIGNHRKAHRVRPDGFKNSMPKGDKSTGAFNKWLGLKRFKER